MSPAYRSLERRIRSPWRNALHQIGRVLTLQTVNWQVITDRVSWIRYRKDPDTFARMKSAWKEEDARIIRAIRQRAH